MVHQTPAAKRWSAIIDEHEASGQTPGPFAPDRSMAANGLVARVLVDKFADHIPANRQAKCMKREGFEIGSHTLSSWVG